MERENEKLMPGPTVEDPLNRRARSRAFNVHTTRPTVQSRSSRNFNYICIFMYIASLNYLPRPRNLGYFLLVKAAHSVIRVDFRSYLVRLSLRVGLHMDRELQLAASMTATLIEVLYTNRQNHNLSRKQRTLLSLLNVSYDNSYAVAMGRIWLNLRGEVENTTISPRGADVRQARSATVTLCPDLYA